jgi:hypothetical protein
MESEMVSAPWLLRISWEELLTLAICLTLDVLDYVAPILLTPLFGDILDFTGLIFSAVYFNWIGSIALLELIPGLDIVPFFTFAWITWYTYRRRKMKKRLNKELERWL